MNSPIVWKCCIEYTFNISEWPLEDVHATRVYSKEYANSDWEATASVFKTKTQPVQHVKAPQSKGHSLAVSLLSVKWK